MNTDYSDVVKTVRDQKSSREILKGPQISYYEKRLGHGSAFTPIIYFLLVSNSMIYEGRNNLGGSKLFFAASVVLSLPIAIYLSRYVFGYTKYRELAKIDYETRASAAYYEEISKL